MLDLQYSEDSRAQVDLNCVMNELGEIIELQGTGEGRAFTPQEQQELVRLCAKGNRELLKLQREILKRINHKLKEGDGFRGAGIRDDYADLLRPVLALQHHKSVRSRTAKGKSLWFEVCIIVGYLCGLAGKFISGNVTYVAAFYILDITMVTIDLVLTIRNKRLDRAAEKEETV